METIPSRSACYSNFITIYLKFFVLILDFKLNFKRKPCKITSKISIINMINPTVRFFENRVELGH